MTKYILNSYGWSMEAVCKSLTDEQVEMIKNRMEEEGFSELHEIRFDLNELLDIDIWDGDLFHHSAAMDNGSVYFEIVNEEGDKVCEFESKDLGDLYETIENFDELFDYFGFDAFPNLEGPKNIYVSIDENKGGICCYEFESDTIPVPSDFCVSSGSIGTPDGDWDFIDKVFFKQKPLGVLDWLDNSGKSSTAQIFTLNGETIF